MTAVDRPLVPTQQAPPAILCVDDELLLLEVVENTLRQAFPSYDVYACGSGTDALECLLRLRDELREVALVLSDEVMPGMTGTDLLEATRELYPDASRVILTGQAGLGSAIRSVRLGLDDYLEKPFTQESLIRSLRSHLDNFELRRENGRLKGRLRAALARVAQLAERALQPVDAQLRALADEGGGLPPRELLRARREVLGLVLLGQMAVRDPGAAAAESEYLPLSTLAMKALDALRADGQAVERVELREGARRATVFADGRVARLAVQELVQNALQHSPAESVVEVVALAPSDRTQLRGPEPPPAVDSWLRRGGCVLAVSNSAHLAKEEEQAIHRVLAGDPRTPLKGFGLAFSAWALELARGSLVFQGRPGGQGATFFACFAPTGR